MHYKNTLKSFEFPKPTQPRNLNLKLTFSKRPRISHCLSSSSAEAPSDCFPRASLVYAASLAQDPLRPLTIPDQVRGLYRTTATLVLGPTGDIAPNRGGRANLRSHYLGSRGEKDRKEGDHSGNNKRGFPLRQNCHWPNFCRLPTRDCPQSRYLLYRRRVAQYNKTARSQPPLL